MAKKNDDEKNDILNDKQPDNSGVSSSDASNINESTDDAKKESANLDAKDLLINELNLRLEEYKLTAQRLQAEFENYRQRNDEAKKSQRFDVTNDVLLDFLTVLDSVNCALNIVKEESLREGINLIAKQFNALLSSYEVLEIDPLNSKFDPMFHNAIMQIDNPESVGNVVQVFQKGYIRKGKVLRYATVKVAV
jgi:molecular chaperone GrpE